MPNIENLKEFEKIKVYYEIKKLTDRKLIDECRKAEVFEGWIQIVELLKRFKKQFCKPKINAKQKGKKGELEAAHFLTDLGLPAHRSQQFKGAGDAADVRFNEPKLNDVLHIEVKRDEHVNVHKALQQAMRDAAAGQIPLVMHRKNDEDWKVTLDAIMFWELWKAHWTLTNT